ESVLRVDLKLFREAMLHFGKQRVVGAVDVVCEEVERRDRGIQREVKIFELLARVMTAQAALITDSEDPVVAHVVLREQRVAIGDRRRQIILNALNLQAGCADGQVRCGIEGQNRGGIRWPVVELMRVTWNGVKNVRAECGQ